MVKNYITNITNIKYKSKSGELRIVSRKTVNPYFASPTIKKIEKYFCQKLTYVKVIKMGARLLTVV
jgi:hypothetical protein